MAAQTKKVILFIAEGPSDESTLSPILKKIFQSEEVRFHVVHGDLTSEFSTTTNNAITVVNDHVKVEMKRYGYKRNDILRIIHLVDTDGAFIPDDGVTFDKVNQLQYGMETITTNAPDNIKRRNRRKSQVMRRLWSTGKIGGTPYSIYYFSRNLEHVLYNESGNLTDDQKETLADDFADTYAANTDSFIALLSDSSFTVRDTYGKTWEFIAQGNHSLHRHCNLHLLFSE